MRPPVTNKRQRRHHTFHQQDTRATPRAVLMVLREAPALGPAILGFRGEGEVRASHPQSLGPAVCLWGRTLLEDQDLVLLHCLRVPYRPTSETRTVL